MGDNLLNFIKGPGSILVSAFFFYMATFMVRLGFDHAEMPTIVFLSSRFLLGYAALLIWFRFKNIRASQIQAVNKKWLWHRALWNIIAVGFFYLGVIYGSVTGANILNMTYPAFVAVFSAWFLGFKFHLPEAAGIILALLGAFFISYNGELYFPRSGDWFGLLSAVCAGFALVALKKIRYTDKTETTLYYTFRLGAWVSFLPVVFTLYKNPQYLRGDVLYYAGMSALFGIAGQIALTYGYRYVSAVEGSIYSSSRLLFALFMGVIFWQKEIFVQSFAGASFIFAANLILAFQNRRQTSGQLL